MTVVDRLHPTPPDSRLPDWARPQFAALTREVHGRAAIYLDGPGGTQVPTSVASAVAHCLLHANANRGGAFATSREADAIIAEAHQAIADLIAADDPNEIVFGLNMTSLVFDISRAMGRTWRAGDQIIVTRLDHDANVTPWVTAAQEAGATVRYVDFDPQDTTLSLTAFEALLAAAQAQGPVRLLAMGLASNAVGTITPAAEMARLAQALGAVVFIDAVHYLPHGPVDVGALGADFVAGSVYKFFGPHVGFVWGRRTAWDDLAAYKVRPSPASLPGRWMTGTQSHEALAGTVAAVNYLAALGSQFPGFTMAAGQEGRLQGLGRPRAVLLRAAMTAIRQYEVALAAEALTAFAQVPGLRLWGINEAGHAQQRVPTFGFRLGDSPPRMVAEALAQRGIFAWAGNFYALQLTERLGLEHRGGLVRVGFVHYNTADELARLVEALTAIATLRA